ncbi:hypothetical protein [Draconibacterium sediminis]|uniref:Uncharacterized protein n=1 Tax=Draconibacterium sediminis TaxID=1544798 RepID=A0A0D8JDX5_9BACT|nr:hypothetical protein [Draconibacterium sediminis]KJF44053.1 hypothetical protein LH29_00495 [Draconibacterium sediminis]
MSEKKQSTSEQSQGSSTIRFWKWSFENVEINFRTVILFCFFIAISGIMAIVLFIVFLIITIKLELFEHVKQLIEAIKA